jgi:histidinol-phosphate aminotransferase
MQPRDLSNHVEYAPGQGIEEVARDLGLDPADLVKLSSNENPYGASSAAIKAVKDTAEEISVYPKAAHTDLTAALAKKWDVESEQVWVSPGADGAIDYLSRAMLDPDDAVLVPEPGFSYYGMSARYHNGATTTYNLSKEDEFTMTAEHILASYNGERLVFVTSPHNPTGATMPRDEIEALLEGVDEETLVVLDEAYGEFAEAPSGAALLNQSENLAILRTFSKAYGLAGLRIGYALVPAAWADAYNRVSTPFAASEVALRAAMAALENEDHVEKSVEGAAWAREYIHENLDAPTYPSEGNFVLCSVGDGSAVATAAQEEGVIIRDCTSFGLPECVRVSCGTEAETRRAVETLNMILADQETAAEA